MFDAFDRPDWDTMWMGLAFLMAQRSVDPRTKHGCVAVDSENTVIGLGYNSFPRKCDETKLPLTAPEKYIYISHAEASLVDNAARNGVCLKGCTVYLTGYPCTNCLDSLINVGVKKVIYGTVNSACVTEKSKKDSSLLLANNVIELVEFKANSEIVNLLHKTHQYIIQKNPDLEIK